MVLKKASKTRRQFSAFLARPLVSRIPADTSRQYTLKGPLKFACRLTPRPRIADAVLM